MFSMTTKSFPLEKIFGSRTRVKIMTLFTTGVKRPYYVREISRSINERLNAVRRELEILRKIGMLTTHDSNRRKYYEVNTTFPLLEELGSIMSKAGPGIEDTLFKNLERLGDLKYVCVSGYFTSAEGSPTDVLLIGNVNEAVAAKFIQKIEEELGREITYTPMTLNEFKYRLNFNDMFLRSVFDNPYKELVNKLDAGLQPSARAKQVTEEA
jgi:DNA-binding transcriptional ArsR family regulator